MACPKQKPVCAHAEVRYCTDCKVVHCLGCDASFVNEDESDARAALKALRDQTPLRPHPDLGGVSGTMPKEWIPMWASGGSITVPSNCTPVTGHIVHWNASQQNAPSFELLT